MKILNFTMKAALCLLLMFGTAQNAVSQVTIGSGNQPHPAALLDLSQGLGDDENLSEKGLLLPRVHLVSLTSFAPLGDDDAAGLAAGMVVYNMSDLPEAGLTPGLYYFNGERWRRIVPADSNWFFMPTIALYMAPTNGTPREVNLWEKFQEQFTPITEPTGRLTASDGAPSFLPAAMARNAADFWFFVTVSDDEVINVIEIDANGVMTYEILEIPTDQTFMNIIFVERY